jgi:hypothetical protein
MSYKILFTDLDGTLLNDHGQISAANREAVALAQAKGKQVVLCSGRSWRSLALFDEELGLNKPGNHGVSFNGGAVYHYTPDGMGFLLQQSLENALGLQIVKALKAFDADILVYAGKELLAENESAEMQHYSQHIKIPAIVVEDFAKLNTDFVKILARGENQTLKHIEREMNRRFDPARCNIVFSSDILLEFSPPNGHKGFGVHFLAKHLGIPMQSVIALGDEANDITMLQAAGLGVAVANAVPGAKAAADITLPYSNHQDALSHVIHTYLLG